MKHPKSFAVPLAAAVSTLLVSPLAQSFSLLPEEYSTPASSIALTATAAAAVLAAGYWINHVRQGAQAKEVRVERQLRAIEKLTSRIGRAEQVLSLKCEFMNHQTRSDFRQVLYGITTDTVRTMGHLRRKQAISDSQFRKLMSRSDQLFKNLEQAMEVAVTVDEDVDVPFLMPARDHALPRPIPQARPASLLVVEDLAPIQPATIRMPVKPRPVTVNADGSIPTEPPAITSSMLLASAAMGYESDEVLGAGGDTYEAPQFGRES